MTSFTSFPCQAFSSKTCSNSLIPLQFTLYFPFFLNAFLLLSHFSPFLIFFIFLSRRVVLLAFHKFILVLELRTSFAKRSLQYDVAVTLFVNIDANATQACNNFLFDQHTIHLELCNATFTAILSIIKTNETLFQLAHPSLWRRRCHILTWALSETRISCLLLSHISAQFVCTYGTAMKWFL